MTRRRLSRKSHRRARRAARRTGLTYARWVELVATPRDDRPPRWRHLPHIPWLS